MYSDNGPNFRRADKDLQTAFRAAIQSDELRVRVADEGVECHFIPPAAPHFGGLWEAGVRSMKHHLRRVLGSHTPTYEELCTLLCRIEACLNSRPLAPLHDDAESLEVLTPAHFLVGGPLLAAPAPLSEIHEIRLLTRWKMIRQLLEQFWISWSKDYVMSCQHRCKWLRTASNISVGQLVLVRNDQLPPAKWELARITECHLGHDGYVRVVTVRTVTTTFKRPIVKLALLPIDIEPDLA